MLRVRFAVLIMILSLVSACRSTVEPLQPVVRALPTVTPLVAPSTAPTPAVVFLPTAAPTATPLPTATALVTVDGARTASMVRLGLAAESYSALGDPNAPITIVEFSDYGCAFCRRHHLTVFPELRRTYIESGLVYYVFKDLPITSLQGGRAAAAVGCSAEQGLVTEFQAALFGEPERWNVSDAAVDAALAALLSELGGDAAALQACLADGRLTPQIDADVAEAHALRLFGTPQFFINGRLMAGTRPLEQWTALLNSELQGGDVR